MPVPPVASPLELWRKPCFAVFFMKTKEWETQMPQSLFFSLEERKE
jgi:hypothetical protein